MPAMFTATFSVLMVSYFLFSPLVVQMVINDIIGIKCQETHLTSLLLGNGILHMRKLVVVEITYMVVYVVGKVYCI